MKRWCTFFTKKADRRRFWNWMHIRHQWEALRRHPELEVVDAPSGVEFLIDRFARKDGPFKGGNADLRVLLLRHDPHAMAHDFDVGTLIDPRILAWQQRTEFKGVARFRDFGAHMRSKLDPYHIVDVFDAYDIVAPPFIDTVYDAIKPRLKRAKFLRAPLGLPEHIFRTSLDEERFLDVFFLGTVGAAYPLRVFVLSRLRDLCSGWPNPKSDIKFYHGARPEADVHPFRWEHGPELEAHQHWYASCLRHAKMMVFEGGVFNYPVAKYFEAMSCGCLVLAPVPRDAAALGFVDGETMVAVDPSNVMDRIRYYASHEAERMAIVERAAKLMRARYTSVRQADIFVQKLKEVHGGTSVEELNSR
jgi:hypothetical protein